MTWWWLSFADATKPRGSQTLGVSIVQGDTMVAAIQRAHLLGCNPGGQVLAAKLTGAPPERMRDRALTADELAKYGELRRGP